MHRRNRALAVCTLRTNMMAALSTNQLIRNGVSPVFFGEDLVMIW